MFYTSFKKHHTYDHDSEAVHKHSPGPKHTSSRRSCLSFTDARVRGTQAYPEPAHGHLPAHVCVHGIIYLYVCSPHTHVHACTRTRTHTRTHTHTHTHTHNQAPSNPSVSKSRLSEMKVQSPGTESQPSKNVCRFPRLRKLAGVGSVSLSPRGPGLCLTGQPCAARLEFQPAASGPAPSTPARPLPFLAGKGRASLRVTPASQEGRAFKRTPPPPPLRPHGFTPLFFFSLLPLPRESSPGSRCRPSSRPKLSPIH